MRKIFQILLATVLMAGFFACRQYETQYEGPYEDPADGGGTTGKPIIYEVLYVEDGQIKLASANLFHTKPLSVSGLVTRASINYAHDRIAYKTATGNISIIDSTGAAIATVPNSSGVIWFDWHPNNQTLYMLQNDQLSFYGPSVTVAATNLANALPYATNDYGIETVAVASDGTVAIGYSIYTMSGVLNGVYLIYPGGGKRSVGSNYGPPVSMRMCADGTRAIVTTGYSGSLKNTGLLYTATGGSNWIDNLGDFGPAAISSPDYNIVMWDTDFPDLLRYYGGGSFSLNLTGTLDDIDW